MKIQKTTWESDCRLRMVAGVLAAVLLGAAGAVAPLRASAADSSGTQSTTQLELYQGQSEANHPFQAVCMLPGDSVAQTFQIQVSHQVPVEVGFQVDIVEQAQQLAQQLQVTVVCTTTGETVYQGPMEEAQEGTYLVELPESHNGKDVLEYTVEVETDTSLGNEYQGAWLRADFSWYAVDGEALTPPQTGDHQQVLVWAAALVAAALLVCIVVRKGARRA